MLNIIYLLTLCIIFEYFLTFMHPGHTSPYNEEYYYFCKYLGVIVKNCPFVSTMLEQTAAAQTEDPHMVIVHAMSVLSGHTHRPPDGRFASKPCIVHCTPFTS